MKITERLTVSELRPGMVLVDPLLDDVGRVLLPRGCLLSESILRGLKGRRLGKLTIARVVDEEAVALAARQESIVQNLAPLFRKAGSGPASRQLYQNILTFLMERER